MVITMFSYAGNSGNTVNGGANNVAYRRYTTGDTLTTGTNNSLLGNGIQPSAVTVSNEITLR